MIEIPSFVNRKSLFDWLITNKGLLISQKKSAIKWADAIVLPCSYITDRGDSTVKAEAIPEEATKIKVRSIVNTTKIYDSHGDVHIDQLWNKSLKEATEHYLTKEHQLSFDGVISTNVKAFVKQMSWNEIGFNYSGYTQALIYDSVIERPKRVVTPNEINRETMFEAYRMGHVKQHSVGMRYVKFDLAVDDDRYEKEFEVWQKYYDVIVNKNDVDENGYFWAVTEAKNIEGAAVVRGSNFATPTFAVQETKGQPDASTANTEPPEGTRKKLLLDAINELSNKLRI